MSWPLIAPVASAGISGLIIAEHQQQPKQHQSGKQQQQQQLTGGGREERRFPKKGGGAASEEKSRAHDFSDVFQEGGHKARNRQRTFDPVIV